MKYILASILFFLSSCVNAADTKNITVGMKQTEFQIQLAANPTTGYQWSIKEYDKTLLQLKNSRFMPSQTKRIGAGGVMLYTFKVRISKSRPKNTKIILNYAQPWEPKKGTPQEIIVKFQ